MNTLLVVPHPDDIEANMAYLAADRQRRGGNVHALVATAGESSTINLRLGHFCRPQT